jgi:hypothetical protein
MRVVAAEREPRASGDRSERRGERSALSAASARTHFGRHRWRGSKGSAGHGAEGPSERPGTTTHKYQAMENMRFKTREQPPWFALLFSSSVDTETGEWRSPSWTLLSPCAS